MLCTSSTSDRCGASETLALLHPRHITSLTDPRAGVQPTTSSSSGRRGRSTLSRSGLPRTASAPPTRCSTDRCGVGEMTRDGRDPLGPAVLRLKGALASRHCTHVCRRRAPVVTAACRLASFFSSSRASAPSSSRWAAYCTLTCCSRHPTATRVSTACGGRAAERRRPPPLVEPPTIPAAINLHTHTRRSSPPSLRWPPQWRSLPGQKTSWICTPRNPGPAFSRCVAQQAAGAAHPLLRTRELARTRSTQRPAHRPPPCLPSA